MNNSSSKHTGLCILVNRLSPSYRLCGGSDRVIRPWPSRRISTPMTKRSRSNTNGSPRTGDSSYHPWRRAIAVHTNVRFRHVTLRSGSTSTSVCWVSLVFSSPEPKAQVSYCHSAPSVVRPSVRRPSSVRPSVNFHIFNFFSRTAWWILMKLGRDEVLMVPYKCCCFSDRSAKGRIQGGGKNKSRGSPFSRIFFFRPEGYSNKPNG